MSGRFSKSLKIKLALAVGSLVFALALAEVALRLLGFRPWIDYYYENEPTMHAPDAECGWHNKPGTYLIPPYAPEGTPIRITLMDDGRRFTGPKPAHPNGEIVTVGGSFTMGWALTDTETYPWLLQERFAQWAVLNYATAGYGTYQSLLTLRRVLPRLDAPKWVIYGFLDHHAERNVARGEWLRALACGARRGHVNLPYCAVDADGALVRHEADRFPRWPLHKASALVALAERAWTELRTMPRFRHRRKVTDALLLQMNDLCKERGARLVVAILSAEPSEKDHYTQFLKDNAIDFIDCEFPLTENRKVPGEGHPNGKMHALWAAKLADFLDNDMNASPR